MELGNEKEEMFYTFPLEVSDEEAKRLRDIGLKEIKKDDEALINYAVNFILAQKVNDLEKTNEMLERLKKKEDKEKKNASKG